MPAGQARNEVKVAIVWPICGTTCICNRCFIDIVDLIKKELKMNIDIKAIKNIIAIK